MEMKEVFFSLLKDFERERDAKKLIILAQKIREIVSKDGSLAELALKDLSSTCGKLCDKKFSKEEGVEFFKEVSLVIFYLAEQHILYLKEGGKDKEINPIFDPIEKLYMMSYHINYAVGSITRK